MPARVPVPPRLSLAEAPHPGDIDAAKRWLAAPAAQPRRIGVVAIAPDAVTRSPGEREYGSYQLFIAGGLDDGTVNALHEGLRLALLEARLGLQGVAADAVEPTMRVIRTEPVLLAREGEQPARRGFNRILPFVMGILLFLGVMMGGQTLMTSTVEEKSSRVVEVLLSALSPLELMWGKLLGQLGVSLLVLAIYIGLGLIGLMQFAMFGLLDPMLIPWLFIFFIVTYLVFGAMMLTIGAAVSQVADAQSLMGPVMLLLVLPYSLTPIIGANPDSTFSVAMSFIPPINTFGMLARMASATPPPAWQPILSLGLSIADCGGGRVVRLQGVPHRAAHARQAAESRDAGALGANGLTGRRTSRRSGPARCAASRQGPAARRGSAVRACQETRACAAAAQSCSSIMRKRRPGNCRSRSTQHVRQRRARGLDILAPGVLEQRAGDGHAHQNSAVSSA